MKRLIAALLLCTALSDQADCAPPLEPALQRHDLMNLLLVIESGGYQLSIVDGDTFERVHRFSSRHALHGEPRLSNDGRYAFFASRDGWISKYDLQKRVLSAEIRAGIETRDLAIAPDGQHVAVANALPRTLVLLDGELNLLKVLEAGDSGNRTHSRIATLHTAPSRESFIVALEDVPEVWEVSYNPDAEDIPTGFVHDFHFKEGDFVPGYLNPRRSKLAEPLLDFQLIPQHFELIGTGRHTGIARVVNIDVRKAIAELDIGGMPRPDAGTFFDWIDGQGRNQRVLLVPNGLGNRLTLVDTRTWTTIKHIATIGPGLFARSHERSPFIWAGVKTDKNRHSIEIFDKLTLDKAGEVAIGPDMTLVDIAFDHDGRHVLARVHEPGNNGDVLIIYDATSLREIKHLPMEKP